MGGEAQSVTTACRVCDKPFQPARPMQVVCSLPCARRIPVAARKAAKAQEKARREAIKPRSKWLAEAIMAFNAYIRTRDAGKHCICCGAPLNWNSTRPGGEIDAGHFMGTGACPELRFDEANVHAQRKGCNRPGGTTRAAFRAGMVERIGLAEVERLEGPHQPMKATVDELKAIKAHYRAKLKEQQRTQ